MDLFDVSDTYKVWSVLPEEEDVSMEKLPVNLSAAEPVVFSVADPRLPAFSHRLVLLQGISGTLSSNVNLSCVSTHYPSTESYHRVAWEHTKYYPCYSDYIARIIWWAITVMRQHSREYWKLSFAIFMQKYVFASHSAIEDHALGQNVDLKRTSFAVFNWGFETIHFSECC